MIVGTETNMSDLVVKVQDRGGVKYADTTLRAAAYGTRYSMSRIEFRVSS